VPQYSNVPWRTTNAHTIFGSAHPIFPTVYAGPFADPSFRNNVDWYTDSPAGIILGGNIFRKAAMMSAVKAFDNK
jgi:hypothetical protein